jgi:hypothetical protein
MIFGLESVQPPKVIRSHVESSRRQEKGVEMEQLY